MQVLPIIIATTVILSILAFLLYVVGSLRLPTGERPKTPTYDRFGELIALEPNPGFEETENEDESN
jgi:hypothetical protein